MKTELRVPFGEWLPDLAPLGNPGCVEAQNVFPSGAGYRSVRNLSAFSAALPATPLESFWIRNNQNVVINFAGTSAGLYRLSGTTWTDVTPTGGVNVTSWEFARFGTRVIAVAPEIQPHYYDVQSSVRFVPLPNAPVTAGRVGILRDFVVLGDVAGEPDVVQWSGFFNSEIWGRPNARFQADFQRLFGGGGRVQKVVPVRGDGVVFQEHAIWLMRYVGPPVVFRLDNVQDGRGTPAPKSVVWYGDRVFFYGWDGFYELAGSELRTIGHNKIDRWFEPRGERELSSIQGAVDRRNGRIFWTSTAGTVVYDLHTDRWTNLSIRPGLLAELLSTGYNLDQLDPILPGGIDAVRPDGTFFSVDSTEFLGGDLSVLAFDSSNRAASFTGAPLDAVIETKEWQGAELGRMFLGAARPIVERTSAAVSVQVGHRADMATPLTWTNPIALDRTGEAKFRIDTRHARLRLRVSGEFDHAEGFIVETRERTGR